MLRRISHALLATLAAGRLASAQEAPDESFKALLPAGAEVIETADLSATVSKPRVMVLWMLNPKRENWPRPTAVNDGCCGDIIHGDFGVSWQGQTRLSLINPEEMKLINTIEVREGCITCGRDADRFTLPLCVLDPFPRGRTSASGRVGKPNMNLADFTGEGLKVQFALYVFEAYGIADTGVFGYEQRSDRVVQYPIELQSSEGPLKGLWVEQAFAREPTGPGYWKFSWEPGHGSPGRICEDVRFDRKRRLFVQKYDCTGLKPKKP
jgi:hypothetical protein